MIVFIFLSSMCFKMNLILKKRKIKDKQLIAIIALSY